MSLTRFVLTSLLAAFVAASTSVTGQSDTVPLPVGVGACSVDAQQTECTFTCLPNEYVYVLLENARFGGSEILGDCDATSAWCESDFGFSCAADSLPFLTLLGGVGTCTLSDPGTETTGECGTAPAPPPPPCTVLLEFGPDPYYLTADLELWQETNGRTGLQCSGPDPDTEVTVL